MGYKARGYYFSHILAYKSKTLKKELKIWSKEVFRNIAIRRVSTLNQISYWDVKKRERILFADEVEAR